MHNAIITKEPIDAIVLCWLRNAVFVDDLQRIKQDACIGRSELHWTVSCG
jgi:hypothetical protein